MKNLRTPPFFGGVTSLTRMTESEKKNRKEMAGAYEVGIFETVVKQNPTAQEINHPADWNKLTTGRKNTGTLT